MPTEETTPTPPVARVTHSEAGSALNRLTDARYSTTALPPAEEQPR